MRNSSSLPVTDNTFSADAGDIVHSDTKVAPLPLYGRLIYPQPEPEPQAEAVLIERLLVADDRPARRHTFVLRNALIVSRRELRDSFRDMRVLGPILTLTLFFPFLTAFGISLSSGFLNQLSTEIYTNRLVPFSLLAVGFFPTSFSLVVALETYIGEKERNTLEALFSSPLSDSEMYVGKLISAAMPPVLASLLGEAAYLLIINTILPLQTDGITPLLLLQFLLLTIVEAFMMVAAALMVSSQSTSVRVANLLASFIIIPTSILVQFEAIIMLDGQLSVLWLLLIGLLIVTTLVLRAGLRTFSREAILTREADRASFRTWLASWWGFIRRTPQESLLGKSLNLSRFTPWRIYRRDIPQILKITRGAYALVTIVLVVGIISAYMFMQDAGVEHAVDQLLTVATQPTPAATPTITTTAAPGTPSPTVAPTATAIPAPTATPGPTPGPMIDPNPANTGASQSSDKSGAAVLGIKEINTGTIFGNNVRAVAVGAGISMVCLGLFALISALINGILIGGLVGRKAYLGTSPWLLALGYLVPHGIIELPMVVMGLGMGVYLGLALISPPRNFSLGQSLQFAIVNWLKILLFVIVPLLLIAAFIEANFTRTFGDWLFSVTGQHM